MGEAGQGADWTGMAGVADKLKGGEIMTITIKKKVGASELTFDVTEEKDIDALAKASFYTNTPEVCGVCQSTDVKLDSNRAESFIFVKIKCNKCLASANAGTFKDGSGHFWKKFVAYEGKGTEGLKAELRKTTQTTEQENGEDLPF